VEANLRVGVKKSPRLSPRQSTGLRTGPGRSHGAHGAMVPLNAKRTLWSGTLLREICLVLSNQPLKSGTRSLKKEEYTTKH
jgi:hypothetical protein